MKCIDDNIHPDIETTSYDSGFVNVYKNTTFLLKQYQYKDKVGVENGDICFDIGAGLGDVSIWFMENGAKTSYAFEIDKEYISCMRRTFSKNTLYKDINIMEIALAEKQGHGYYVPNSSIIGGGKVSSCTTEEETNSYQIKLSTIDDVCDLLNVAPSFIKMDIEGAELEAVNGGRRVFETCRPKFAICVYHNVEHMWEIPLILNEICPDYAFFLKKSSPICETVFFGRPLNNGNKANTRS